jgi:hypothetical protein
VQGFQGATGAGTQGAQGATGTQGFQGSSGTFLPPAFVVPGTVVYAAINPVGGNDATGVFAAAAPALATASPFQSVTGLLAALPRFGNNCIFVCLMAPGSYFAPFTLLPDNLNVIGYDDYQSILFRGSDFTNSAADLTQLGETTVANTSTLGYTVQTNVITPNTMNYSTGVTPIQVGTSAPHGLNTGNMIAGRGFTNGTRSSNAAANGFWTVTVTSPTTFTLDGSTGTPGGDTWSGVGTFVRWSLTDNSGNPVALHGPPGFPTLIGKRFMFDAASPTTALQNASFPIIAYDTQHIIFGADPGAIAAGDFGRFQEPAVIVGQIKTGLYGASGVGVQFAGISAATIISAGSTDHFAACEQTSASGALTSSSSITVSSTYVDELGLNRFVGVGLRAVATAPSLSGTVALVRLFHAISGNTTAFSLTTARGAISDGYYGNGLLLTDCGGKGGFDAVDGALSIGASNAGFMRGPRIIGSPTTGVNIDALYVRSSSAIITGADLSGATGGSGGSGLPPFLAGLQIGGYASNVVVADVSGHNNSVSVGFQEFDSDSDVTMRAKCVLRMSSGSIGLYSFVSGLVLFADAVQYQVENFSDLVAANGSLTGIEDGFENCLLADNNTPSTTGVQTFLARYPLRYAQQSGSPLPRYSLVAMPGGQNSVALAIANNPANARLYLGSLNGQMAAVASPQTPMHVSYGQVGFCFLDLTGGHGAAAAGQPLYLSQTRAGFAQADRPVAGVALKIGISLSASVGGTGLVMVLLAGPNVGTEDDFFELNLSFRGAIPADAGFNLQPSTDGSTVIPGLNWEWECPFNTTGMEIWVNVLTFSGTIPMTVSASVEGVASIPSTAVSGAGLFSASAAVAVSAGQTVGITITTPNVAGSISGTDFTVRLRLR